MLEEITSRFLSECLKYCGIKIKKCGIRVEMSEVNEKRKNVLDNKCVAKIYSEEQC